MKTAIMTDTNSGITVQEGQALGIYVLPMPVLIDGRGYYEGVNLTSAQLYEAMREDRKLSTSQPAPGEMTALWERILSEGYDEIVHIPMSSGLSGSCQSAALLAQEYEGRVRVVDNHRISVTQRESVLDAKRLADAGVPAAGIQERLEAAALQASIYITVDSLKYLQRGGRLSPSAALLGTVLSIKPILSIQGEKLEALARMRGMKLCERKMIDTLHQDLAERFAQYPAQKLRIYTAGTLQSEEEIGHWRDLVQSEFPEYEVGYAPLPCSIACHVGPQSRGIGVAVTL